MSEQQMARKKIWFFLILTTLFSAVMWVWAVVGTMPSNGILLLTWCPGLAAIITQRVYHKTVAGLGWRWGKTRYQFASYLIPIGYAGIAYGLVWLLGLGELGESPTHTLFSFFVTTSLFIGFAALGEEVGWRGLLVPELAKLTGFTNVSLISGVIWAVWHYPLIFLLGYHGGTDILYSTLCFTVMATGISFVYTWMRIKSGSVYTAMFLHLAHNLYIQQYFDQVTVDTGITKYITGEFGAALALMAVVVAFVSWKLRGRLPAAVQA